MLERSGMRTDYSSHYCDGWHQRVTGSHAHSAQELSPIALAAERLFAAPRKLGKPGALQCS
ncbi:MAG: hypothetical protein ACJAQZ_004604 [Planctomycetota bacterium]|jgi:hypothetical protein